MRLPLVMDCGVLLEIFGRPASWMGFSHLVPAPPAGRVLYALATFLETRGTRHFAACPKVSWSVKTGLTPL